MKYKFITLTIALLGFVVAKANNDIPGPGPGDGKRDDVNGTVIHAESKKPLKDVSVTAILVSKKEKIDLTDETGNFSFDELKPGTYKFIFEKAGFKKITREKVVVKTDEAFQLNIEMIESNEIDILPSPFHFSEL
jgi:Cna protein B-type domain.